MITKGKMHWSLIKSSMKEFSLGNLYEDIGGGGGREGLTLFNEN